MQAPFADPLSGLESRSKALPLIGRDIEMQLIRMLLDNVAFNEPAGVHALLISGDRGIGKSRLLVEMSVEAKVRGFRVLEGRTYESGSMFPYLPFIEALRPVLRSSNREQLNRYVGLTDEPVDPVRNASKSISRIGHPLIAALARLFPELLSILQVTIMPEVLSADQEKFRLFDAIATLLERMAIEQPVMLSIDNLQWADSASLELMMYLTVRLHNSQIALAGATRPPDILNERRESGDRTVLTKAANAASKILGELIGQGLLLLIPLGPLSMDAAEQHLHVLLPGTFSDKLAQSLLSRAEGNPFFLEELVRTLTLNGQLTQHNGAWQVTQNIGSALPESIMLAVSQRLQGLSVSCRELLHVASLFGRTFPLPPLVIMLEETEDRVQSLIDEAILAGVISKLLTTSTVAQEYAEEQTPEGADQSALGAINRPLRAGRKDGESLPLSSPTYLFCQGIIQEALSNEVPAYRLQTLHGSIARALEAGYGDTAQVHAAEIAHHFVLGGEKQKAFYWSYLAGEEAIRQQAYREAISHFQMVAQLLESNIDIAMEQMLFSPAELYISLGESWFKVGELEQASHAFQQALERLQGENVLHEQRAGNYSFRLAQANRLLADVYRMQGKYELALAHLQAARNAFDADRNGSEETNSFQDQPAHPQWLTERSFSERSGMLNLKHLSATERILLLQGQATIDLFLFHGKEAETALWQSYQLATEIGDKGSQAFALHMIGWIRGWGERIHEAIRLQEQALKLYLTIGDPYRAALCDQGLGIIYLAIGEIEQARLHTLRGLEQARRYGVRYVLGWLYWNQSVIALTQGDWANSERYMQQAMQEVETTNNIRLKALVIQGQAELKFRQGDWHAAEQLFSTAIEAAINTEWYPSTLALYGHFLAVTGRRSAARIQLERAASLPEPTGYSGHFYIPLLAEGYLHLEANERAVTYIERIRGLHGFMYYGASVDRILGEVAMLESDWDTAERAFEDGLALCARVNNQPEEAAILYEQARATWKRSGAESSKHSRVPARDTPTMILQKVHSLCDRARELFLLYKMQRAVELVNTFQKGVRHLEQRDEGAYSEYHLELSLTRRELEVLRLVAEGHTDREVAETLVISHRTVNRHLSNIFVKLDVPGRAAAVAYAIRQGLVG